MAFKITSMVSAAGWFALYKKEDGSISKEPVAVWASDGNSIRGFDSVMMGFGNRDGCEENSSFVKYEYAP